MHRLHLPGFSALFLRLPSRNVALLAAFILAATALHVALVVASANPIPYSDEWIAIVDNILRPAATGQLSIVDFFRPHNEHTMAPTRLLALLALWLNHGQFDNVPVALFNALLYAGAMAVPIFLFFRHAGGPARLFALVLGGVALVPIEGEDLIFGFQNQYYFLIAGTVLTLWIAATTTVASKRALAGFAAAALFTAVSMGSGFFAAIAASIVFALRWRREPGLRRSLGRYLLVAGIVTLLGVVLVLHAFVVMRASGILGDKHIDLDVVRRIFSCLAWPYGANAWLGLVLSLPFAAFAWRLLRQRDVAPLDHLALALGLWTGAQICALAFDRHSEALSLASRYLPVMLFWPAMNVYAVFRLADRFGSTARAPAAAVLAVVPALVAGAFVSNVAKLAPASLAAMTVAGQQHQMQAEHIARYVRLADRNALYGAGHMGLPYPNTAKLQALLDDPAVRDGLPANVRAPLALAPDASAATPFVPFGAYTSVPRRDDLPGYGSHAQAGDATVGTFRSAALHTRFPFVRIDLAGYLPDAGLALRLECTDAAACTPTDVRPPEAARESWRGLYVRVPQPDFRIVADDASKTRWLAFSAPLETGRLSVFGDAFVNRLRTDAYTWIALLCGILAALLLVALRPDAARVADAER